MQQTTRYTVDTDEVASTYLVHVELYKKVLDA
jgi:hypothetical protein